MDDDDAAGTVRDVTDDVSTVISPSRRAVDFSISSLLSSQVGRASTSERSDGQLPFNCSHVANPAALLPHRLAAAAVWYPWLHGVASLQSATSKHHLTYRKFSSKHVHHCQLGIYVNFEGFGRLQLYCRE